MQLLTFALILILIIVLALEDYANNQSGLLPNALSSLCSAEWSVSVLVVSVQSAQAAGARFHFWASSDAWAQSSQLSLQRKHCVAASEDLWRAALWKHDWNWSLLLSMWWCDSHSFCRTRRTLDSLSHSSAQRASQQSHEFSLNKAKRGLLF